MYPSRQWSAVWIVWGAGALWSGAASAALTRAPGEPAAGVPAAGAPVVVELAAVEPAAMEPPAMEPPAMKLNAVELDAVERAAVKRAAVEPVSMELVAMERAAMERAAVERAAVERTAVERAAVERAAVESVAMELAAVERAALERAAVESAAVQRDSAQRAVLERAVGAPGWAVLDDEAMRHLTAPVALSVAPRRVRWAAEAGGDALAVTAVTDASLDRSRGGFEAAGGLMVSLGVERLVSVNGRVLSSTAFNIADLGRLSGEQAKQAGAALTAFQVLQNGPGNVYLAGSLPPALGGTVLQNSLNDQVVRTHTVINAGVNSLDMLKTLNFQDGLRTALSNVAGTR